MVKDASKTFRKEKGRWFDVKLRNDGRVIMHENEIEVLGKEFIQMVESEFVFSEIKDMALDLITPITDKEKLKKLLGI